jgi:hypothetical protein
MTINLVIEKPTDDSPIVRTSSAGRIEQAAQIPLVRKAMELLDARIIDVRDDKT